MPDPQFIGAEQWARIGELVRWLWLMLVSAIIFAFSFGIAHAWMPSLEASGELPPRLRKARPLFYATALVGAVLFAVFLALAVSASGVIWDIYDRWWY